MCCINITKYKKLGKKIHFKENFTAHIVNKLID